MQPSVNEMLQQADTTYIYVMLPKGVEKCSSTVKARGTFYGNTGNFGVLVLDDPNQISY